MREVSNNVIAILIVIFITVFLLEISVYVSRMGVTARAGGIIGFCVEVEASLDPIGKQTAFVGQPYFYDANYTSNDTGVRFFDNANLFEINNVTGVISFTPNGSDLGTHYVLIWITGSCGTQKDSELVEFEIKAEDNAPILDYIPDFELNQSDYFWYDVNATDPDNDTLTFGDTAMFFDIDPSTGVITFVPSQGDVGVHDVVVWVRDPFYLMDWQSVMFNITDINDCPYFDPPVGAQTAIINETYFYDVNATDVDVKPEWSNLTYYDNSTFFDISPTNGTIEFFVNETYNGTYAVNISVTDGICMATEIISFSVIAINHPPEITYWFPENYTIEIDEGDSQLFWITKFDLDGTTPSTQWYFRGAMLWGETNDNYTYYSNHNSAGTHNVTVVISDGLLTDYHNWTLIVHDVPLPPSGPPPPTGAPPPVCVEKWKCTEWSVCPVYEIQTRRCWDENNCGTTFNKPHEMRTCVYVPEPSCEDGIVNCHHGSCEIWIDCGGPCPPCPTCSDKIQNCHRMIDGTMVCEGGIDCDGPCPPCEIVIPAKCGDGVCERDEIFTCFRDCGLVMGEYLIVVILLALASVMIYRGWYLIATEYKRRRKPMFTDAELLGVETLRKLHLIQLEIGKKSVKRISAEFSKVIRDFFARMFSVKRTFTYIELNEIVRKRKVKKKVADMITGFSIRISEIEYGKERVTVTMLVLTIKDAVRIVEGLTGVKMHEALRERAGKELKKSRPEEVKGKIELEFEEEEEKAKERVILTKEDLRNFGKLREMVSEGEEALKREDFRSASDIYSKIRFLYDRIPDSKKEGLYEETVRIIKIYNRIMENLGGE
jgi:hypothetical protein